MDLNSYVSWLQSEVDSYFAAKFYSFAEEQINLGYGNSVILGEVDRAGGNGIRFVYPGTINVVDFNCYDYANDEWYYGFFEYGLEEGYLTFQVYSAGYFALTLEDQFPDYIESYGDDDNVRILYPAAPSGQPLPTPTGLYADNVTSDSARIGWNQVENASGYKVEYRQAAGGADLSLDRGTRLAGCVSWKGGA